MKTYWIALLAVALPVSVVAQPEDQIENRFTLEPPQRISPRYRGDDHAAAFSALKRLNISEKSEFETTMEFQARLDSASRSGKIDFKRDYSFLISNEQIYAMDKRQSGLEKITYDADNQQISVSLEPEWMMETNGAYYTYSLSEKVTRLGNYIGSNAFGKKVSISKSRTYRTCLAMKYGFVPSPALLSGIKIESKFSQKQKYSIAVIVTGKIVEPFVLETRRTHDPTIDSPYDYTIEKACIVFRPSSLTVFDTATGQILRKVGEDKIRSL